MGKKNKRDCATCGWGVRWVRGAHDGRLHGRCLFEPSIPVPRHYGWACGFGEETPMPDNCPAWKRPDDVNLVPRWKEEEFEHAVRKHEYAMQKLEHITREIERCRTELNAEFPEYADRI